MSCTLCFVWPGPALESTVLSLHEFPFGSLCACTCVSGASSSSSVVLLCCISGGLVLCMCKAALKAAEPWPTSMSESRRCNAQGDPVRDHILRPPSNGSALRCLAIRDGELSQPDLQERGRKTLAWTGRIEGPQTPDQLLRGGRECSPRSR